MQCRQPLSVTRFTSDKSLRERHVLGGHINDITCPLSIDVTKTKSMNKNIYIKGSHNNGKVLDLYYFNEYFEFFFSFITYITLKGNLGYFTRKIGSLTLYDANRNSSPLFSQNY